MTAITTLAPSQTAYIADLVCRQRDYFATGETKDVKFRVAQM